MKVECSICNNSFANKNSLYQHRNKFHKTHDKTSNNRKVLLPNPIAEGVISTHVEDINRKRNHSNEDQSEESEYENEAIVKKGKVKNRMMR